MVAHAIVMPGLSALCCPDVLPALFAVLLFCRFNAIAIRAC